MKKTNSRPNAVLIGIDYKLTMTQWTAEESLNELEELVKTAQLKVVGKIIQKREMPDGRHYIGKGKLDELEKIVQEHNAEVIIADDELKPAQIRHLEKRFNIKIMDRTGIVLDIFAKRAKTHEAKLQVELAQLNYLLPRLTRLWTHLSRLGGGIGTKGPGETQLEVDKRLVNNRLKVIKENLKKVQKTRFQMKQRRSESTDISTAIVGYTNAGKSTLMNRLTQADVYAEDQLFATLDPTTRKIRLPSNDEVILSDTVGFIQKLPHQLVDAFMSTLEEVVDADFLIHMVDISSPKCLEMIETSQMVLKELNVSHKPQLMVFNKTDNLKDPQIIDYFRSQFEYAVFCSLTTDKELTNLFQEIKKIISKYKRIMTVEVPFSRMDIITKLHQKGTILEEEYGEKIKITVEINSIIGNKILGDLLK